MCRHCLLIEKSHSLFNVLQHVATQKLRQLRFLRCYTSRALFKICGYENMFSHYSRVSRVFRCPSGLSRAFRRLSDLSRVFRCPSGLSRVFPRLSDLSRVFRCAVGLSRACVRMGCCRRSLGRANFGVKGRLVRFGFHDSFRIAFPRKRQICVDKILGLLQDTKNRRQTLEVPGRKKRRDHKPHSCLPTDTDVGNPDPPLSAHSSKFPISLNLD